MFFGQTQATLALYAAQRTSGIVVNIGFQVTSFAILEPPKHEASLTFYVSGLKPRPNDLEMASN